MDGTAEVELLRCNYAARCRAPRCRQYRATTIVRYLEERGHLLRQFEACDEHAGLIVRREQLRGMTVRDIRGSS